jgi:NADH:ubiquinone oxidoreductase subunit F (NADH-binding)/NADH:ubiquinone oxidoreductase subunit E
MLVQRLREIQHEHGYLPDAELRKLARDADVPLYRVEEVTSFFSLFRLERHKPLPDVVLRVCRDMTCHLRGAAALLDPDKGLPAEARRLTADSKGKRLVVVEGVSCLGRCDRAPAAWAERHPVGNDHGWVYAARSKEFLADVLRQLAAGKPPPPADRDDEYLPQTNPGPAGWEIDVYGRDRDRDYAAVQQAVTEMDLARRPKPPAPSLTGKELDEYVARVNPLIAKLKTAGVLGMGGAGTEAAKKWLDVWRADGDEKYVVANGDESEPGTFKDREIMLRTPHLVVEGVILAGLATGATRGYIYVRHEYHEQIEALRREIERAEAVGACGPDVFESGRAFPVEVFESPGGYICGEQSALIEAMEGKRAQPRNKPPELSTNGLWDKPTLVNNVETLAWAPAVVLRDPKLYANGGWKFPGMPAGKGFGGRRLLSVSGDVRRPGVYEVPIGMPLRELVESPTYCGGVVGGKLKAVATSGPSSGFLPARVPVPKEFDAAKRAKAAAGPIGWFLEAHLKDGATHFDLLDVPLDLGFFRLLHSALDLRVEPMLGAGLVVYNEKADILSQAANATEFFRNESCGKCVPCRVGSQKLVQIGSELLGRRAAGEPPAGDDARELGRDVREVMRTLQQTSICGLGYVAPTPLSTALAYFPADVSAAPRNGG